MIFTVSVYSDEPSRHHCWGYYFDRKAAEECIAENWTDIFELGYYSHALLAAVGEGPMGDVEELQWYRAIYADRNFMGVAKVDKPAKFEYYSCGGVGG